MRKVVIIDDNEDIMDNLKDFLTMNKFDVYTANNGEEGIKIIKEQEPDIVICDVMMPKMNGYEVLKELRSDLSTYSITFLFLTSKDSLDEIRLGMMLGADDYITKPFTYNDLLKTINIRINKSEKIREIASTTGNFAYEQNQHQTLPFEISFCLRIISTYSSHLQNSVESLSKLDVSLLAENINEQSLIMKEMLAKYENLQKLKRMENVYKIRFTDKLTNTGYLIVKHASIEAERYKRKKDIIFDLIDIPIKMGKDLFIQLISELSTNLLDKTAKGEKIYIKSNEFSGFYILQFSDVPHDVSGVLKGALLSGSHSENHNEISIMIAEQIMKLADGNLVSKHIPGELTEVAVSIPMFTGNL